eukprot:gene8857-10496_t
MGAHFTMYLANMMGDSSSAAPVSGVERFAFVLNGTLTVTEGESNTAHTLTHNHYAYFPAGHAHRLTSSEGCSVLIFERFYAGEA